MHILIGLLVAAAGAFWAFRYFVGAAHEGREAIRDVKGLFRSGQWSRKVDRRLIEIIEDPKDAAAVLAFQVAAYDGAITDRQRDAILSELKQTLGADDEAATALFAFARRAIGEIHDAGNNVRKLTRPIIAACTPAEKRDLVAMLRRIAAIEGPVSDIQERLIEEARRLLEA